LNELKERATGLVNSTKMENMRDKPGHCLFLLLRKQ